MIQEKIYRFLRDKDYRFFALSKLGVFDGMSDEWYLKTIFKIRMGHELDLTTPETFNEKIQWLKLNDRKPIYTTMVDKYEVKKYIASIIGDEYIIPTLGVWDKFQEIDFKKLPDRFVLKCTHDSGGVIICRDRNTFDSNSSRRIINKSLKRNFYYLGREWPYKDVKKRILAEKYMEQEDGSSLVDYKFFCFNGIPKFLYVSKGLEYHPTAQIGFYNMDGEAMNFHRRDYECYKNAIMPANFGEMKSISQMIAEAVGCPFVRIDLYSINNSIYFSEITFSPCAGMIPFEPIDADTELGKMIKLPIEG